VLPYLANVINAWLLAAAVAGPPLRRIGWASAITLVTLTRLTCFALTRASRRRGEPRRWAVLFTVGIAVGGAVWGLAAFLFWQPGDTLQHALLAFVAGGMVAGASATTNTYLPAFFTFSVTSLGPVTVRLLASGNRLELAMGAMTALFGFAMSLLARNAGRWFVQTTELRLRNEDLVARLSDAREHLEGRVAERTEALESTVAQLRQAEQQAQEALRARNDFLAVASHELRTPLATMELHVRSLGQRLARAGVGVDVARLGKTVHALERQQRRVRRLLETVLASSGALAGDQASGAAAGPVDLAEIVRGVVEDATGADDGAPAAPVEVRAPERLVGRWDAVRVEQIAWNLLSNALKYAAGAPVEVALERDGDAVVLSVSDRGPGISEADRDRIFERFFRANTERRVAGLGLGLSVVRELAESMHGSVAVRSQPGEGATFTVRLPAQQPEAARATVAP
jgi:signal transduction histidine kinase